ncbi:hypothetical protein Tco_1550264 [Tanacetum coccineum]
MEAEKETFVTPPPMSRASESRNKNKCCDFHGDNGHNTDDCLYLKRQIEEAVRSGQLAHLVKEIKHGSNKASTNKATKKIDATSKDKGTAIFMNVCGWGSASEILVNHLAPRVNTLASILGKVPIRIHGMDELLGSQAALAVNKGIIGRSGIRALGQYRLLHTA